MTTLIADYGVAVGGALLVTLLLAVFFVSWRARKYRRETERLRDDVHRLLAGASPDERIVVNGRAGSFVDIAASVNRLLDRTTEAAVASTTGKDHFEILANTVPEVALVHTSTILHANEAAGGLFGVAPEALLGLAQ